ncbi:MAG: TolC family protein, partial [Gammaproteobacteria bacterium]|nr:TolC family protein [Gammaproteobacteria bacterium]
SVHKYNFANLFYFGFTLFFIFLSYPAHSQELNLDDFIESILKNNPGVQKILSEKGVSAGLRDASLGVDDATLGSSISLSHAEPDQIIGSEPDTSDNVNLNISYSQVFSNSGTRLSLGYNSLYTDRDPVFGVVGAQYYQPSFTVKLTQPLLKNAGGIQDSLDIKISQLNFDLAGLSSQENLESYITQLASLYIDWYLASRELNISKEVHQQSIEQEKLTRIKVKRQVIEPYELLRAQEITEDYFSRWQQAKGRFTGLTHQIKYQMNISKSHADNVITPLNPEDSKLLSPVQGMFRETNYLGTTSRLKDILDILKKQQVVLLEAKDNFRSSDLNLSVAYTRHGLDDGFSDAHSDSLEKDDYSVMLEYKYPLGNRKASGNFRSQVAKKQQIESDTKQRLIDAKANLANLESQSSQLK